MLESLVHPASSFVTLTYAPENLPPEGNLVPKHSQDWLKRIRYILSPRQIRYYLVGEYGDESWRPHYHVALFGVSPDESELVKETWGLGHVYLGELTLKSSQYIAGYVTKKMTNPKDERLRGLHPEFARMSLRPGIGAHSMDEVARAIKTLPYELDDVPGQLMHGSTKMPLGRYLRRKLREKIGRSADTPRAALEEYGKEMRRLFENSFKDPKTKTARSKEHLSSIFANHIKVQEIRDTESRLKLYSSKGKML